MRSCEDFESLLPAYVAGVASPADAQEIGEHIAECGPCMNDFQRIVRDLGALKLWREPSAPEGLGSRILEKLVDAAQDEERAASAAPDASGWGEPLQQGLTAAALVVLGAVTLAMIVASSRYARYEDRLRQCRENLREMGVAAALEGELKPPLGARLDRLTKKLPEDTFTCPVALVPPPGRKTCYRLDLAGPRCLAGDWRTNHFSREANLLLNDGSVIHVTPSQPALWDVLAPSGPAR